MIYFKDCDAPPLDRREVFRYAGAKESTIEAEKLLDECIEEAKGKLLYKVCWTRVPARKTADAVKLCTLESRSVALRKHLGDADEAVIFAATLGIELDRLISRYSRVSPAKALLFQALGAERIEALCDAFCEELKSEGFCGMRFSPGYDDFCLEAQKEIFRILDCPRKIGLTLNESLIMSPSKSVTAIVAKGTKPTKKTCDNCLKTDCEYRRK